MKVTIEHEQPEKEFIQLVIPKVWLDRYEKDGYVFVEDFKNKMVVVKKRIKEIKK